MVRVLFHSHTLFIYFLLDPFQLDLVVRDSEANILDPGRSSAVTLYREHKLSSDNRSRHPAAFSSRSNSYMLLLSVKNFTWKRSEDMELFISVYTTGGKDGNSEPRFRNLFDFVLQFCLGYQGPKTVVRELHNQVDETGDGA